jgi:hypothetical protein
VVVVFLTAQLSTVVLAVVEQTTAQVALEQLAAITVVMVLLVHLDILQAAVAAVQMQLEHQQFLTLQLLATAVMVYLHHIQVLL